MLQVIHIHFPAWDTALFLLLNGCHSPAWDAVMRQATGLWNSFPLYLWMALAMVRSRRLEGVLAVVCALACFGVGDQLGAEVIKPLFARLRPTHAPALEGLVHVVTGAGGRYGFVSIHAVTTFSLACFTALVLGRSHILSWIVWPWAFFVSYSRIYVGKHYPIDVMAGATVGLLLAVLFYLIWRRTCDIPAVRRIVSAARKN